MKNIKDVLSFLVKILQYNHIDSVDIETLRKSKYNESIDLLAFKIANLKLIINYIICTKENVNKIYKYDIDKNQENVDQLLYNLLWVLDCPLVLKVDEKIIYHQGSREQLMIFAWILSISDIFSAYSNSIIDQAKLMIKKLSTFNPNYQNYKNNQPIINNTKKLTKCIELTIREIEELIKYKKKKENKIQSILNEYDMELKEFQIMNDQNQFKELLHNIILHYSKIEEIDNNYEDLFYQWMESTIDLDKKEYLKYPDYGYSDEIKEINLSGCSKAKITQEISQIKTLVHQINEEYDEFQEDLNRFNNIWEQYQKYVQNNKQQDIQNLQQESDLILQSIHQQLVGFDQIQQFMEKQNVFNIQYLYAQALFQFFSNDIQTNQSALTQDYLDKQKKKIKSQRNLILQLVQTIETQLNKQLVTYN